MAQQVQKKCSIPLIIRELQIKSTMRFHLTLVKTAIIKKSTNNKCWRGCGKKGILLHCWWDCKRCSHYGSHFGCSLENKKIELPNDPAILLLGIYTYKTIIQKHTCTPIFTAALFIIPKTWKLPKCPSTDEWVRKMWYIYTKDYYTAVTNSAIKPSAVTSMQPEIILLVKS